MKNVSAHSVKSPVHWLVNPFTDWKANLVSAIQNGTRALFVCAALTFVLVFALPSTVQAQNKAATPYINSWHQYAVIPMGDATNTYKWILYGNETDAIDGVTANGTTSYELVGGASQTWVKGKEIKDGNAYVEIYFDDAIFKSEETWYLVYSEYSGQTCIARRRFDIAIKSNSFYLTLDADNSDCNTRTGSVWDNSHGNISTRSEGSNVSFTVKMHKDETFTIKSWKFTGKLDVPTGSYRNSVNTIATSGTSNQGYACTLTGNASSFTLVVTVTGTETYSSDFVTIDVGMLGDITADYEVRLNIAPSGEDVPQATSGNLYDVVTDDNGSGDKVQDLERFGIPNTSVITVSTD